MACRCSRQALARLVAQSRPLHRLRSQAVSGAQLMAFGDLLESFLPRVLGRGGGSEVVHPDEHSLKERLRLPLRMGEGGGGGVEHRADAALVTGSVAARPGAKRALGTEVNEQARRAVPRHFASLETATERALESGADRTIVAWRADQPVATRGLIALGPAWHRREIRWAWWPSSARSR